MKGGLGKTLVRASSSLVNLVVIVILLAMLALGCYSLWDSNRVYAQASSSVWTAYKPLASPTGGLTFEQLQALNPEVIGWIDVYGTDIDYPVAQSTDNIKYVNYNAKGEYALSGCPFLDCDNKPDFSDFVNIIYGHHMDVPAMFGQLDEFENADYFDSHKYGSLYYGGALHGIEFFAFLSTDAYNSAVYSIAVSTDGRQAYIDNLLATAKNTRDIGLGTEDTIVLLSTCSTDSTAGRFIIAARVSDTVRDDPFATDEVQEEKSLEVKDYLLIVPWWVWLAGGLFLVLIVCLVIYNRHDKTQGQRFEELRDSAVIPPPNPQSSRHGRSPDNDAVPPRRFTGNVRTEDVVTNEGHENERSASYHHGQRQ